MGNGPFVFVQQKPSFPKVPLCRCLGEMASFVFPLTSGQKYVRRGPNRGRAMHASTVSNRVDDTCRIVSMNVDTDCSTAQIMFGRWSGVKYMRIIPRLL